MVNMIGCASIIDSTKKDFTKKFADIDTSCGKAIRKVEKSAENLQKKLETQLGQKTNEVAEKLVNVLSSLDNGFKSNEESMKQGILEAATAHCEANRNVAGLLSAKGSKQESDSSNDDNVATSKDVASLEDDVRGYDSIRYVPKQTDCLSDYLTILSSLSATQEMIAAKARIYDIVTHPVKTALAGLKGSVTVELKDDITFSVSGDSFTPQIREDVTAKTCIKLRDKVAESLEKQLQTVATACQTQGKQSCTEAKQFFDGVRQTVQDLKEGIASEAPRLKDSCVSLMEGDEENENAEASYLEHTTSHYGAHIPDTKESVFKTDKIADTKSDFASDICTTLVQSAVGDTVAILDQFVAGFVFQTSECPA